MDEIVKDFLIESGENLDRLDQELVQLETDPQSKPLLASIFRTIHTIKGSCGFLGFARLEKVAHAGENLLSRLREGELSLTAEMTSGLLAMVDAVRHMLSDIQATEHDGEDNYPALLEMLKGLQGQEENQAQPRPEPAAVKVEPDADRTPAPPTTGPEPAALAPPEAAAAQHRPTPGKLGGLLVERGQISAENLAQALAEQEHGDQRRVGEILVALGLCKQEDVLAAQQVLETRGREAGVETVRVGVNLLDKLMNLVGELVLARNQLLQCSSSTQDAGFHGIAQRMNLIASELQEEVMKTRMQPIGNVWNKFPRTVRDLALACGKEVRVEMVGQETELDRTILEAVKDPLTHLVRNSVDHGIETPAARTRAGKSAAGCLSLRAFHEGGQVNIEIADDGAGLNLERIRSKAVERGVISPQQAARMPDHEIFNLIFLPGFSTAEKVTNVSGRGVGMDVVRTNLEKIGGTVELQSAAGHGTTVRIKIPLTLAIVPALMVRCGGERFAIPQISLTELVRLESNQGIERVHEAPVYRLRGRRLPLIFLREVLHPKSAVEEGRTTVARELMDFAAAREKHAQWLDRLQEMLDGKASVTVEQAGSPRECALGKWLYGVALREYGDISEMHILEQAHQRFHALVREIVIAKVNGFDQKATEIFGGVAPLTRQIVDLLTVVENERALALASVNIVVLQAGSQQFGLVVDDILDTEEIVVKPLGKQLRGISAYAGATIMGDGSVALILDVMGLAQCAKVIAEGRESAHDHDEEHGVNSIETVRDEHALLLAENGLEGRVAIPLSMVARLEEFPRSVVERAGTQEVMQYRGQIIPLVRLSQVIPTTNDAEMQVNAGSIQVVVYSEGKHTVGLIVDRIVDIVEEQTAIESVVPRAGIVGSFVTQHHVTDLLDVPAIVRAASPGLLDAAEVEAERA